jgi:aspartokinase
VNHKQSLEYCQQHYKWIGHYLPRYLYVARSLLSERSEARLMSFGELYLIAVYCHRGDESSHSDTDWCWKLIVTTSCSKAQVDMVRQKTIVEAYKEIHGIAIVPGFISTRRQLAWHLYWVGVDPLCGIHIRRSIRCCCWKFGRCRACWLPILRPCQEL